MKNKKIYHRLNVIADLINNDWDLIVFYRSLNVLESLRLLSLVPIII